jgi:hypothetical protein
MYMGSEKTKKNLGICKEWAATEGVDKVMEEHGVDIIVAPCDSFFAGVGVGASGFMPLEYADLRLTNHAPRLSASVYSI